MIDDNLGVGDPIPGSRFVRAFCSGCGTPMRVDPAALAHKSLIRCEVCRPHRRPSRAVPAHRGVGFDAQDVPEVDDGQ